MTRTTESANVFYTNKSNKTAAYCIQPGFSRPMQSAASMFMQAVYLGADAISSTKKEEVRYV
nr:hypothetical protein [Brenneria goodwinii]